MQELTKQQRLEWIDALRGMAMLFVLYGHMIPEVTPFFVFTSPIKIPLFFAITGYVFNQNRTDFVDFVRKLSVGIIVPWIFLYMSPIVALSPLRGSGTITDGLYKMLSGAAAWYMPCCVIAETIHYLILKSSKGREVLVCVASLFLAGIGFVLGRMHLLDFAMLNRALVAQSFILIGYVMREVPSKPDERPILRLGGLLYLTLCVLSLIFYPEQSMDVHLNRYYNIVLCSALIAIGCVTVFMLFKRVTKFPKFLSFIGQNTLVYYIWGGYAQRLMRKAFGFFGIDMINNSCLSVLGLIGSCTILGAASLFLGKTLPFAIGRERCKAI